jgi:hypothetical protein
MILYRFWLNGYCWTFGGIMAAMALSMDDVIGNIGPFIGNNAYLAPNNLIDVGKCRLTSLMLGARIELKIGYLVFLEFFIDTRRGHGRHVGTVRGYGDGP